jgi:hypothetical protein
MSLNFELLLLDLIPRNSPGYSLCMTEFSPEAISRFPLLFDIFRSPDPARADLIRLGLHPPLPVLVSKTGNAVPALIWGQTIAETARALGIPGIAVREIPDTEISPAEAFVLALELENRRGRYSPLEMELAAETLERLGPDAEQYTPDIAALMSGQGALRLAGLRLRLRPDLRLLVREEKIDLKTAELVREIPEDFFASLGEIIGGLSFSERRIFLTQLTEILAGKTSDEAGALRLRLAKARNPAAELNAIRMPELSSLESRFQEISRPLLRGSGISLKPPPWFEGSRFSLSFSFGSSGELLRKIRALEKLAARGEGLYDLL